MNADQARKFLHALGASHVSIDGNWAKCSCILAPFTHKSGKDASPSFAVRLGEKANYNCFACGGGTLATLLGTLSFHLKQHPEHTLAYDLKTARQVLDQVGSELPVLPEYKEFTPSPFAEFQEWPGYYLDQFPVIGSGLPHTYLMEQRHLTESIITDFKLKWDPKREMIVAPVFTAGGKLAGCRGRYVGPDKGALQHYDYTWHGFRNTHLVWFNERALTMDGPLVLVEGQFDAMRVSRYWPKVMSVLSSRPTEYKLKKLCSSPLLLCLDNDKPGYEARDDIVKALQGKTEIGLMEYPTNDPSDPAYFKDCGEAPEDWLQENFSSLG